MATETLAPAENLAGTAPFTIGVCDKDGKPIEQRHGFSDPCDRQARHIDFDIHLGKEFRKPTSAQMECYRELTKVEHALDELFPVTGDAAADAANEKKFRPYFVRLFHLAQLILEGDVTTKARQKVVQDPLPDDIAKSEVQRLEADLLDDEAPRIKNQRLSAFLAVAGIFSLMVLAIHLAISLTGPASVVNRTLTHLAIDPQVAANFMLLLFGTFMGVWLAYAIRMNRFSVTDLTRSSTDDFLAPVNRLILAGTFATLLVLLALAGVGNIELANVKLTDVSTNPLLAFVVGAVIGLSEQKLSGTIEKSVGGLFGASPAKPA